ncbi:hydroxyacylglutathione hydrolase [Rhizobium sp. CRIBSB]|nr:hydroxyacylglutathione hydrolase [Rhizobium sp. CRIBSB]
MTLSVHQFACLTDNYGFLIRDEATGMVATIDTPDADRIQAELAASGWGRLDLILNTHWHADHAGGNAALKAATGAVIIGPHEVARISPLDCVVGGDETVMLGETALKVAAMGGHTLGHLTYRSVEDGVAFVGDVIFALGCGRLFEGTPEQMWASLQAIADWPDETLLYCAHEYSAANARFALSVDRRPELAAHAMGIFEARERGEPTVPTRVDVEKAFNPFLTAGSVEAFAARRAAKDTFKG